MIVKLRFSFLDVLFFLGVALLPLYMFGSGGVQPAHMVFFLFVFFVFLSRGVVAENWTVLLLVLGGYTFAVESFYAISTGKPNDLINSIFIIYNLCVASAVYSYCSSFGFKTLVPGVIFSALLAVSSITIFSAVFESGGVRSTGTFNNPNQLGYFSVCILSLTYLLHVNGFVK